MLSCSVSVGCCIIAWPCVIPPSPLPSQSVTSTLSNPPCWASSCTTFPGITFSSWLSPFGWCCLPPGWVCNVCLRCCPNQRVFFLLILSTCSPYSCREPRKSTTLPSTLSSNKPKSELEPLVFTFLPLKPMELFPPMLLPPTHSPLLLPESLLVSTPTLPPGTRVLELLPRDFKRMREFLQSTSIRIQKIDYSSHLLLPSFLTVTVTPPSYKRWTLYALFSFSPVMCFCFYRQPRKEKCWKGFCDFRKERRKIVFEFF